MKTLFSIGAVRIKSVTDLRKQNRRQFLGLAASASVGILWSYFSFNWTGGRPNTRYLVGDGGETEGVTPSLASFDPVKKQITRYGFRFTPHEIISHPRKKATVVAIEKYGQRACLFELESQRETHALNLATDFGLAGHGTFNSHESVLYLSQWQRDVRNSFVGVYDGDNLKPLDLFPSAGVHSHQISWSPDYKHLIVAHKGGGSEPSKINYIDPKTRKVTLSLSIHRHSYLMSHFVASENALVAVSDNHPRDYERMAQIFVSHKGGELRPVRMPDIAKKIGLGQTLSVALDKEQRIVCATNPRGRFLGFYEVETAECVGYIDLFGTSGVTLSEDGSHFLVTTRSAEIYRIDAKRLQITERVDLKERFGDGSHVYPQLV